MVLMNFDFGHSTPCGQSPVTCAGCDCSTLAYAQCKGNDKAWKDLHVTGKNFVE